jgi:hypothetical protein
MFYPKENSAFIYLLIKEKSEGKKKKKEVCKQNLETVVLKQKTLRWSTCKMG